LRAIVKSIRAVSVDYRVNAQTRKIGSHQVRIQVAARP
jgi:hypothetical protein